jgi:hypothetical protein
VGFAHESRLKNLEPKNSHKTERTMTVSKQRSSENR